MLLQAVRILFGNYATRSAKEERPAKSKSDTRGHPTWSKTWTSKSICSHIFTARISDKQMKLSGGGEKDIGKYCAALLNVFKNLSEAELKECEDRAAEWNTESLPDEMQHK